MVKKSIAIIGSGPSALMLACMLDNHKFDITIYEKNAAPARKFLVAGDGGLNLTHSENAEQFIKRYAPPSFIEPYFRQFSNQDLIVWFKQAGVETFVGSSKRVFPVKGIKPVEVLNALLKKVEQNNVNIQYRNEWCGWDHDKLLFKASGKLHVVASDSVVFALGGASWKVTGSEGSWTNFFADKGIETVPFYPSNCAYHITWSQALLHKAEGKALKNCEFKCGSQHHKGEAVITAFGIEGSGVYPLSPAIRAQLQQNNKALVLVDFKPLLSQDQIVEKLQSSRKAIKEALLNQVKLSEVQIELIKSKTTKEQYNDPVYLASLIKSFPLEITDTAPIDDAISTVGGICREELTDYLELKKLPSHFCIGEMIDWDAPTGGYLLQANFSMGYALAMHLNKNM